MNLTCHHRGVILAVHGVLATRLLVLVMLIDARALLVEARQNIGYVGGESPWLLEVGVRITPRRLEIVLASVEVREEEIHPLHEPLDLVKLPVGAQRRRSLTAPWGPTLSSHNVVHSGAVI